MDPKRKGSCVGAPTNRKRKTPITGRDNACLDVPGSATAPNSDLDDGEPQEVERDIKVELDSEVKVEPMADEDNEQVSLGDLSNGVPVNMDSGEYRKMYMRDFKAENHAEHHGGVYSYPINVNESDFTSRAPKPKKDLEMAASSKTCTCKAKVPKFQVTEMTGRDPKPEKGLPVSSPSPTPSMCGLEEQCSESPNGKLTTTESECENFAVTGEEENNTGKGAQNNTESSSHLVDFWKAKATKMGTKNFELKKKTWELKADLAYWKGKAKELERNFIEVEQAESVELAGSQSQSAAANCPLTTLPSTSSGISGSSGKSGSSGCPSPIPSMNNSSDATGGKTRNMSSSVIKQGEEMEVDEISSGSEYSDCVVDMAEDHDDELNSSQVIVPGGKEHPTSENSSSNHCPGTNSESEMTIREPRREDLPATASGSNTSKSTVGSTECENTASAPTETAGLNNNEVDGSSINGSSDVNSDPLLDEYNETRPKDFSVVSKGYCFLCLDKISPFVDISSPSVTSFEDISRYLKIDMRKVFIQGGAVPDHLLEKVRMARLTVELCEGCSDLTRNISKRCLQSENLKMEIESGLESIYGKIYQADETGRTEQFRKVLGSEWYSGMGGVMEILEGLRMETKQQCFSKMNTTSPRLHQETVRIFQKAPDSTSGQMSGSGENPDIIQKEERAVANRGAEDDVMQSDNSLADDFHDEVEESDTSSSPAVLRHGDGQKDGKTTNNEETERKWTINSDTGKYKCRFCPAGAEYATPTGVRLHYNKVHLKLRFDCKICGKEFSRKSNYEIHHKSVHLGIRFQCNGCKKSFTEKGYLMKHLRTCAIGGKR